MFFSAILALLLSILLLHSVEANLNLRDLNRCIVASEEESALGRWMECMDPGPIHSSQDSSLLENQFNHDEAQGSKLENQFNHDAAQGSKIEQSSPQSEDSRVDSPPESLPFTKETVEALDLREPGRGDQQGSLSNTSGTNWLGDAEAGHLGTTVDAKSAMDGSSSLTKPTGLEVSSARAAADASGYEGAALEQLEASCPLHSVEEDSEASAGICNERRMDAGDVYKDQGEGIGALSTVLKLNAGALVLSVLLIKCSRGKNCQQPRSKVCHKSNGCNSVKATYDFGGEKLHGTQKAQFGTEARDWQPGILGPPLGTALGAVLAEVFLSTNCSSRQCVSADELSTILEIAMMEALMPVVGDKCVELVEKFKASFRSTYKTICRVHQACSKDFRAPCQALGDSSHNRVCPGREQMRSANPVETHHFPDAEIEALSAKFSQQMNLKETHARNDNLRSPMKDVTVLSHHCFHCKSSDPDFVAEVESKNAHNFSRDEGEFWSGSPPTVGTVVSRACKKAVFQQVAEGMVDSTQFCSQGRKTDLALEPNSCECGDYEELMRQKGHISKPGPASPIPSVNDLSKDTDDFHTMQKVQGCSSSMSNGNRISSYSCEHVQQAVGTSEDIHYGCNYFEQEENEQEETSLSCNGTGDEIKGRGNSHGTITSDSTSEVLIEEENITGLPSLFEPEGRVMQEHVAGGMLEAVVLAASSHVSARPVEAGWQEAFLHVFEKSVQAQERHNYIKSIELAHTLRHLTLEEEQLQLASESNELMKENLNLGRSRASFKERQTLEQRVTAAHIEFSRTCADELVAGLFVMLLSLSYGVRKYSFALLFDLVSTCQPSIKEPRQSSWLHIDWLYNSLDSLTGQLQAFACQVTVAGRLVIGLVIVFVVASALLRQSVTSSSQAMPATIIIIVLGGVCGFAGKLSVDSLGGNGLRWLLIWETFCVLHALANCFTPSVFILVNGPPSSIMGKKSKLWVPLWVRRLAFHTIIVLVLPVLAGQLPFGSFSRVTENLFLALVDNVISPAFSFREWVRHLF